MLTVLPLAIGFTWYINLRSWSRSISERLLAAFLLTTAQMIISVILLGFFGWYRYGNLTGFLIAQLVAVAIRTDWSGWLDEIKSPFATAAQLPISQPSIFLIYLTALTTAAVALFYAFALPAWAYDVYHIVRGVLVDQTGHLPPFGWDDRGVDFYPGNVDMLFGYWITATRSDSWLALVQFWFALAGTLAIYRVIVNVTDLERQYAGPVAVMVWSCGTYFHESWLIMNDLALAVLIWITWAFVSRRKIGVIEVGLAGLAAGLAIGTKTSAVYWLAGTVIYLIWRLISDDKN